MASLTVRDLDDDIKARLRVQAAENGRSMEAEARAILRDALARRSAGHGLGTRIRRRFADLGDVQLDLPDRSDQPRAADLAD